MATQNPNEINLLALENQFCFALYSTSLALTKSYKPLLDKIGLTYPQYLVMLTLWQQDHLLVKEIGELLFLDSGTLTPLLKRMELAELIQRQRDPEDERQVRISLTRQGKLLRNHAKDIPEQILCASGQSAANLHKMRQELVKLRTELLNNAIE
ncbi:MarR family transcriptional regulator [Undibacterium cyanobacteriorum]|uniref:MarR family transcriptional regulator n=1 Tax=Undibacterium cyanobacteriorum TaxID=3073561 RepID=A0ABY9RK47_9BURK|nr:MarR family transcriptional regulator [Undibacterium sp. 20NA77.5]WMW81606.1 MarR family transcriptional regulator [Undibacterium sp. 20NA77.5]